MSRTEELEKLREKLVEGVAAVQTSEEWKRYLDTAARFHKYSARNLFLILLQKPEATQCAGYKDWQRKFKRQVRGGEKGLRIYAPNPIKVRDEKTGEEKIVRLFKAVSTFDVSQTDGEPLPDATPHLLTGEAPAVIWERVVALLTEEGWTVERGECGGANGFTSFDAKVIKVRDDVEPLQALKTLVHEYGHSQLHEDHEDYAQHRGRSEVEAESVAYLVLSSLGLDSSGYSFKYVAAWATKAETDVVIEAAGSALKVARKLLEHLDAKVEVAA